MAEPDPHSSRIVDRLRKDVVEPLKRRFVGRDEVADLIALAVVSGEHLFLLGPPGTAKSAVIRGFAEAVQGRYFEYLLTRFSEPNELFGPIDLARLREGAVATVTSGMLPEAEFAFLDELFNANSAILNNLLTVLNERIYRRGSEVHRLPLLSLFTASNHLAEDEALRALFDRFLIRCRVDNLDREAMPKLLLAGWELERSGTPPATVSAADLRELAAKVFDVDLSGVSEAYAELVWKIRDLGVALSDRRAVKILKMVAASSLLSGRMRAASADLWVLRYVWDREEQIDPLRSLVGAVLDRAIEDDPDGPRHPLAEPPDRVDGEEIARQLDEIAHQLSGNGKNVNSSDGRPPLGLTTAARLRERLAELADRASWIPDEPSRRLLVDRASSLLDRLS